MRKRELAYDDFGGGGFKEVRGSRRWKILVSLVLVIYVFRVLSCLV